MVSRWHAAPLLLAAALAASAGGAPAAGPSNTYAQFRIPGGFRRRTGHYIAVFQKTADNATRARHMDKHRALASADPHSEIHHTFKLGGFEGYTGQFSATLLASARADGAVEIELDMEVGIAAPASQRVDLDPKLHAPEAGEDPAGRGSQTGNVMLHPELEHRVKAVKADETAAVDEGAAGADSCSTQSNAVWGLVRSGQRARKLNGEYTYEADGAGVQAYILDTGVYTQHNDFGGRAVHGVSFTGEEHGSDQNGHGTHVAGTIGSNTYGVAKQVSLVGVQVLGAQGNGYMSWVIKGLEWVCNAHKQTEDGKCVVNLSLSGGLYQTLNNAANELVACGCTVAVAAGNDGSNACYESPASATDVVTVGASDNADSRAYFSNFGACVDIFAPGVYITSTWIGSKYAINTISGTSMASPHVAGAAAKVLSASGSSLDTDEVKEELLLDASAGYLSDIGTDSPNRLLYEGCSS